MAKTLDTAIPEPSKNQGGIAIVEDMQKLLENHPHDSRMTVSEDNICQTLSKQMGTGGNNTPMVMSDESKYSVRRLTPLECERLQGLPDYYTLIPADDTPTQEKVDFYVEVWREWNEMNGKKPKTEKQVRAWLASEPTDSARYKMLGNGIALPQWEWVLGRMTEYLPENATCASLFDGTGSFPLIWENIHGQGTAVWSSEVDPEPIRVSQYRINRK